MFVRFVAACFMVIGLLELALYLGAMLSNPNSPRAGESSSRLCFNSIPFVAGVVILIKAKAIANWISDKLE